MDIVRRHGEPWIKVSPLGKQEEPENLVALKAEIERRWGTIDLIDILKEAEFPTGFTAEFTSVASREAVPKAVLRRRLLLLLMLFALGTNMGIKRVAVTGKHSENEAVLRRVRHLFVNRTNLRAALVRLVNATFAARDSSSWGEDTACASDSKKLSQGTEAGHHRTGGADQRWWDGGRDGVRRVPVPYLRFWGALAPSLAGCPRAARAGERVNTTGAEAGPPGHCAQGLAHRVQGVRPVRRRWHAGRAHRQVRTDLLAALRGSTPPWSPTPTRPSTTPGTAINGKSPTADDAAQARFGNNTPTVDATPRHATPREVMPDEERPAPSH
ncbi:Tn3 family transposase [Streptomyces griseoluteus]|uniref:Tn3 family transposase n=1 Tax=Streptomyces griseoluteus TaxID=29306 RepID=UPI003819A88C